jgi:hypothetical protein
MHFGVGALALRGLLACEGNDPGASDSSPTPNAAWRGFPGDADGSSEETPRSEPVPNGGARPLRDTEVPPGSWCARAGKTEGDWVNAAAAVAVAYIALTTEDCETSLLMANLDVHARSDWKDYLLSYTLAIAQCPLVFGALDDGVGAFGPANLSAIGRVQPRLGNDDVTLLSGYYSTEFGVAFELRPDEVDDLDDSLRRAALAQLDPAANRVLSSCSIAADAGN